MKKILKKVLVVSFSLLLCFGALAACGNTGEKEEVGTTLTAQAKDFLLFIQSKQAKTIIEGAGLVHGNDSSPDYVTKKHTLGGSVRVVGSTSVQPIIKELADEYETYQRDVAVSVSGTGSGQGREEAQKGLTSTFGIVSAELSTEQKKTLQQINIATDGIAVISHKNNNLGNLSKEQVAKIFTSENGFKNWSDVGSNVSGAIILNQREDGSGTRSAFEEIFNIKGKVPAASSTHTSTGAMRTSVAGNGSAIGYVSVASIDASIKALSVDGVAPSTENIKNKSYTVSRPFAFVLKKDMVTK